MEREKCRKREDERKYEVFGEKERERDEEMKREGEERV